MFESFSNNNLSNTMVRSSILDLAAVLTALASAVQGKEIYVSPAGTGLGSQTAPYGSIQSAVNLSLIHI